MGVQCGEAVGVTWAIPPRANPDQQNLQKRYADTR